MIKLIDKYKLDILNNKFIYDIEQESIVYKLNDLFNYIIEKDKNDSGLFFLKFLQSKLQIVKGLYIYGDVGRGKTYLVDLFFYLLPINKKKRLHFHHFMTYIHTKLKYFSGQKDPLKLIAKMFSEKYTVICLDEFFVKDIADAMILSKLFYYLFENKLIFVITSNIVPSRLYYNGLQRQKFLPAISLIENNLNIASMNGEIDYRLRNLEKEKIYLNPLSLSNFKLMKHLFFKLSTSLSLRKNYIKILDRKILTIYLSDSIVWFDFNIICGYGRSQLDYMEIASLFNTVFISGIDILRIENDDNVRRFISLIDEFYDRKINVVLMANSCINDLYIGVNLAFDFKRTVSRVIEMGTIKYLRDFDKNDI